MSNLVLSSTAVMCTPSPSKVSPNPSSIPAPSNAFHRSTSEPALSRTNAPSVGDRASSSSHPPPRRKLGARKGSKNSDLTEERLKEFNRRNQDENKKKSSSPYYHGLTDSALYINSLRPLSPGRESHVTTGTISSFSSVITKIQAWGSTCFKGKGVSRAPKIASDQGKTEHYKETISKKGEIRSNMKKKLDMEISVKSLEVNINRISNGKIQTQTQTETEKEEKPLRERVSISSRTDEEEVLLKSRKQTGDWGQQMEMEKIDRDAKERQFVWADMYRPKALRDFICNKGKAEYLHTLATQQLSSHFIFEGPPGVGKRTMVLALLREFFGPERLETTIEWREFVLKGEPINSIQVRVKVSAQHVEINPSELRGYEKHVMAALIKEADTMVINQSVQCDDTNQKAIVLCEADKLSTDAQHYIRWLMERYKSSSKIIFCCTEVSKLQPIRSLCTIIRLEPPSNSEIVQVLEYVSKQEGIELPHHLAERIAQESKQNLRQAVRSFEASWKLNQHFQEDQVIITGWEEEIANIAKNIIEEQSPKQLYIIRGKLQKLIAHNVSPDFIFGTLVEELKKNLDEQLKSKIDSLYMEYTRDISYNLHGENAVVVPSYQEEESGKRGHDPARKNANLFIRIEEFTARFMSLYKSVVMNH